MHVLCLRVCRSVHVVVTKCELVGENVRWCVFMYVKVNVHVHVSNLIAALPYLTCCT